MDDNKLSIEWLKNNGHKLKIVYSYAIVNKLDIKSQNDVLKILMVTDSKNANAEQAKIYSKMLQLFADRFRSTIKGSLVD